MLSHRAELHQDIGIQQTLAQVDCISIKEVYFLHGKDTWANNGAGQKKIFACLLK